MVISEKRIICWGLWSLHIEADKKAAPKIRSTFPRPHFHHCGILSRTSSKRKQIKPKTTVQRALAEETFTFAWQSETKIMSSLGCQFWWDLSKYMHLFVYSFNIYLMWNICKCGPFARVRNLKISATAPAPDNITPKWFNISSNFFLFFSFWSP